MKYILTGVAILFIILVLISIIKQVKKNNRKQDEILLNKMFEADRNDTVSEKEIMEVLK